MNLRVGGPVQHRLVAIYTNGYAPDRHSASLILAELRAGLAIRRQGLARMVTVYVPHERRVDVVAEEFLEPFGQLSGCLSGHGQAVVLLLSQPACAVFQDHAEPRPIGLVRAATMPETAQVEHGRARRHDGRRDLVVGSRPTAGLPLMTTGNEPGRAVLQGELVERPHGIDDQWRVR